MATDDMLGTDITSDVVDSHAAQREEARLRREAEEDAALEQRLEANRLAKEQAAAAPVAAPVEETPPAEDTDEQGIVGDTIDVVGDVATGFAKGVVKEGADVLDNFGHLMNGVASFFGIESANSEEALNAYFDKYMPEVPYEERMRRIEAASNPNRRMADEALGEAEGAAEQIGESLGAIPYVVGAMSVAAMTFPVSGTVGAFGVATAGGALGAGAIANTNDPNMGNVLEDSFGPNFYSNIIAIDGDDSKGEKFLKHVADDVALALVAEPVMKVAGAALKRVKRAKEIADDAVSEGIPTDPEVAKVLDELDEKTVESQLLDQAVAQLDEGIAANKKLIDDQVAANAAADEAVLAEPIGVRRSPVVKTALADLGDEEFDAARAAADKRVFDLEADENIVKADTDPATRRELIDAQDDFTAHELEAFRRKAESGHPEDLAQELRGLRLTDPEDKVKATMIASGMAKRSADEIAQFEKAMGDYANLSPDHAEVLGGQLEKFEATVREAQGDVPTADSLTGVPAIDDGSEAIRQRAAQLREEIEELQEKVVTAADTSPAHGGYMEAVRQTNAHNLSPKANEALGAAATRNAPKKAANALQPPRRTVGGTLEMTDTTFEAVARLRATGDTTAAARLLGASIFDVTNYDRIVDGDGVEGVLRAFGELFGDQPGSARLQTSRSLKETQRLAQAELRALAEETGGSIQAITAALEKSLPGANLDVQLTALRHAEVSLASKIDDVAADFGTARWTPERRVEALQWGTMLAQINDRRAGIASELGRALNALKITAKPTGFLDLDSPLRNQRRVELDKIITGQGGPDAVDDWIKGVRLNGGDLNAIAKGAKAGTKRKVTSIGDFLHRAFVVNLLSGPATATINLASNLWRGGLWEPSMEVAGAGALSLKRLMTGQGDAAMPWQELSSYFEGMLHGAQSSLRITSKIIDGQPKIQLEGSAYKSFQTRRRMTAPQGNSLQDVHLETPFSSVGVRQLVKDGLPVTIPFTGGKGQMPLLGPAGGPLRRQTPEEIGSLVEARSGIAHKTVDYMGRVFETPFSILAGGDELTAAISYNARAFSQITKAANNMPGLTGVKRAQWIERAKKDLTEIDRLREVTDPADVTGMARLKQMESIHAKSNKAAEISTHTQKADAITQAVIQGKGAMPILRWLAPFVKTPTQLIKDGVTDFNVVGQGAQLASSIMKNGMSDDAVAEAAGRFAAVGAINATMAAGILSGKITGSGPTNLAERQLWLDERDAEGNLVNVPNSIEIPGIGRVQYNRMDPVAIPMALAADIQDLMDRSAEGETDGLLLEFGGLLLETLKNKSYLESLTKWIALVDGDAAFSQAAMNLVVSTGANTFVPWSRFWANTKQGGAPGIPEDLQEVEGSEAGPERTLGDYMAAQGGKINIQKHGEGAEKFFIQAGSTVGATLPPGIADGFMKLWQKTVAKNMELTQVTSLDFFGEPRYNLPGWGPDWGSPFKVQEGEGKHTPLNEELSKLGFGVSINKRFGKIAGIQLTPTQQHKFQKLFAKPKDRDTLQEQLGRLMIDSKTGQVSDRFNRLGDSIGDKPGGKVKQINSILQRRQRFAEAMLLRDDEDLRKKVLAARQEQRKMLTDKGSDEVRESLKPKSFFDSLI